MEAAFARNEATLSLSLDPVTTSLARVAWLFLSAVPFYAQCVPHFCTNASSIGHLAFHPGVFFLHGVIEQLVQARDLARHAEVDGALADLDDQATEDVWVDFGHGLELLSLAVLGLGNGGFEALESFVIEFLYFPNESVNLLVWDRIYGALVLTAALVTVSSTSPLAALIRVVNLSHTPSSRPSRLFSASADKKFLTVPLLSAPPVCFSSSATIWDLSESESVGAERMVWSFGSDLRIWVRLLMALEVGSRTFCLAAAVYCVHKQRVLVAIINSYVLAHFDGGFLSCSSGEEGMQGFLPGNPSPTQSRFFFLHIPKHWRRFRPGQIMPPVVLRLGRQEQRRFG